MRGYEPCCLVCPSCRRRCKIGEAVERMPSGSWLQPKGKLWGISLGAEQGDVSKVGVTPLEVLKAAGLVKED